MIRGILATCYGRPAAGRSPSTATVMDALREAYARRAVRGRDRRPAVDQGDGGLERAHVTARVDPRTGWVIALCALDNLVKGASGQAIQCANIALGLPETTGLPLAGVYP